MAVVITGKNLTVEEVVSVARGGELVEISLDSQKAVKNARDYVEKKLSEGTVIYGLTTGFGKFSDTFISREETGDLQRKSEGLFFLGAMLWHEVIRELNPKRLTYYLKC